MAVNEMIIKKSSGIPLRDQEIQDFVKGLMNGDVQDSQLGAMLMAIFMKGMNLEEIVHLTRSTMESGETLKWPEEWKGLVVDKHSTGGVGDKISLPLAPALASFGLKVPMISGRGLGYTGGTLDKLESIPGFNVHQDAAQMKKILEDVGCCIVGQTETLVPADRIMYATRDVTGTVASIPLISASIISKKAAEGLSSLVLDVKYGSGAFLKDKSEAIKLAKTLVNVSNGLGVNTTAILSNMECPLGRAVGNAIEVEESILCLKGKGPSTIVELVTALGGQLLVDSNKAANPKEGAHLIKKSLEDGSALKKFEQMMVAQGVDEALASKLCSNDADYSQLLPKAQFKTELKANKSGYVHLIEAHACAYVSCRLGAGRAKSNEPVDHAIGLYLSVQVGDYIKEGDVWVTIFHNTPVPEDYTDRLQKGLLIENDKVPDKDLVLVKQVIIAEVQNSIRSDVPNGF